MDASLELRVLAGRQRGARSPLAAGTGCILAVAADGSAEGADVVLCEEGTPATRICITPGPAHATLDVMEGTVRLGTRELAAGDQALWLPRTRLVLGAAVIAFGPADEEGWQVALEWETAAERRGGPAGNAAEDGPAGSPRGGSGSAGPGAGGSAGPDRPRRRWLEFGLIGAGAAAAIACAATIWAGHVAPVVARTADPEPAAELAGLLDNSPFPGLAIQRDLNGRLQVSGRLPKLADQGRLEAWLAEKNIQASLKVSVDEAVIRDVTEVFRVNNVADQARLDGPGEIEADAAEPDPAVLARAEAAVRHDVPGLASLTVRNGARPKPARTAPVADDPNKRIVTIVAGDPAYVVTVDGARYFVGAVLPTGHRIIEIAAQQVTLDRAGEQTILNF